MQLGGKSESTVRTFGINQLKFLSFYSNFNIYNQPYLFIKKIIHTISIKTI